MATGLMKVFATTLVAVAVSACSSGTATPRAPGSAGNGTASFTIEVPATKSATGSTRRPAYVSPATQSVTLALTGPTTITITIEITTSSPNCTTTAAGTECREAASLAPGNYTANVTTYNAPGGAGTALSANQNVPFTITTGTYNPVTLTLNGIPHSLSIASTSPAVASTGSGTFRLTGPFPAAWSVQALDANGYPIIGQGVPTYGIAQTSGSAYGIVQPSTASPNAFSLANPSSNARTGGFTATATYGDDTCTLPGAVCTATFSVTSHLETYVVQTGTASQGTGYVVIAPPYAAADITPLSGISSTTASIHSTAFDASGNLFVIAPGVGSGGAVLEYAPPYTGAPVATIGSGTISLPMAITIDDSGDLFVADFLPSTVYEFTPPYSGPPVAITNGMSNPDDVRLDANGNLFVANFGSGNISRYTSPYTGMPQIVFNVSEPPSLNVDAAGDVFALSVGSPSVTWAAPPYLSTSTISAGLNNPQAVGIVPTGGIAISNGNLVNAYASPYTTVSQQVTNGISGAGSLAFDGASDLLVGNQTSDNVTVYVPPYSGTPVTLSVGSTIYDVGVSP